MLAAVLREEHLPTPLHREIGWFQEEIRICEAAIREAERIPPREASHAAALAKLHATLASHRNSLAELEKQLDADPAPPR